MIRGEGGVGKRVMVVEVRLELMVRMQVREEEGVEGAKRKKDQLRNGTKWIDGKSFFILICT